MQMKVNWQKTNQRKIKLLQFERVTLRFLKDLYILLHFIAFYCVLVNAIYITHVHFQFDEIS